MPPVLLALLLATQAETPARYPSCQSPPPSRADRDPAAQIRDRVSMLVADIGSARDTGSVSKGRAVNLRLRAEDVQNDLKFRLGQFGHVEPGSIASMNKRLDAVAAQFCGAR